MKYIFSICTAFIAFGAVSQDYIRIEPTLYSGFIQAETQAFKVEVDRVERKPFMDHWEEYLEDVSEMDIMKSDHLIKIEKAELKSITMNPVTIYMYFEDMEGGSRVFVGFQDTVSGFIGMSDAKYGLALTNLIRRETKKVFVAAKQKDMKAEDDHLEALEKDLSKIKKEEDKINKKIISKQRDIEKLENEIDINKSVLSQLREEIGRERGNISAMPTGVSEQIRDAARKELKNKEKAADKVGKSIDKESRSIYDEESDIREYEYELEKLKQDEKFAEDKVLKQREIINALREEMYKLKN